MCRTNATCALWHLKRAKEEDNYIDYYDFIDRSYKAIYSLLYIKRERDYCKRNVY